MENNAGQEPVSWHTSPTQIHQKGFSSCSPTSLNFDEEPALLEETIQVVQEKVWSFRSAWKSFAERFCRYGVSPTIVGYSTVPTHEDDYLKEHGEDELALAKIDADGSKLSSNLHTHHSRSASSESMPGEDNLLLTEDCNEENMNHPFAESEEVEKTSLTGPKKVRAGGK